MVNKVILIGNLGRDPEVRSTPSGQPVASFTLATSRRWRDKSGAKHCGAQVGPKLVVQGLPGPAASQPSAASELLRIAREP